jgi:hypothetical protein
LLLAEADLAGAAPAAGAGRAAPAPPAARGREEFASDFLLGQDIFGRGIEVDVVADELSPSRKSEIWWRLAAAG